MFAIANRTPSGFEFVKAIADNLFAIRVAIQVLYRSLTPEEAQDDKCFLSQVALETVHDIAITCEGIFGGINRTTTGDLEEIVGPAIKLETKFETVFENEPKLGGINNGFLWRSAASCAT